ncbi:MAG: hypothetical protein QXX08_10380, partial [Candidatus Bathyarchaeia archaeon]
ETKYAELEKEYKKRRGKHRKAIFYELIELKKEWKNIKRKLHDHFRPIILERDNYKCRVCGSTANLELARLFEDSLTLLSRTIKEQELFKYSGPYRTPEERYSMENMFILCKKCHRRFDSFTGRLWRMGPKAISSIQEAVEILRNKELFDKPHFVADTLKRNMNQK